MSLTLQVLSGLRSGERIHLQKLTTIGREAEISFDDPKMSKIHAIFEFESSAGWLIRDPGSKNGVLVNGHKTQQHLLSENDVIDLGATQLRVEAILSAWRPILSEILVEGLNSAKNQKSPLMPFRTLPRLTITQGLQTGETYILEYGPRTLGGDCEDILLFEPQCPDLAFTITPAPQGALFETRYPQVVRINGSAEQKKLLKNSDQISIHNTVIEVSFVNT